MTGIQDNSYTPDYLDSQAEDRYSTDANHVSGDFFKSRRSGSTPSLTGSGVSNPSTYPVSSTPVNLPPGTNISQSNSSGRSSRGTTPPAPSFRKGKGGHSSGQGSDNSRSSHSKSPKQSSLTGTSFYSSLFTFLFK
ncbi:uncharacterized protein LOC111707699 [Eurytemora carolleeae]|uniref:uncharacterized protein LOC111707699 n=1 Tax=Eurytemora carolleeae TaxID=1294199 RepID=UPI000C786554|nr:uncharacterized protein LOC111707699 [Eurytemora carolleeae]|eukprot:XP_023336606.1 uncharacterized protein LOC111707699 [Eurytemora affinis]